MLTIYLPESRQSLWSRVTPLRLPGRDDYREKIIIDSAKKILEDLKTSVQENPR